MDIPHRAARPAMALPMPEIHVHDSNRSDRFRTSSRSSSYNSILSHTTSSDPMSIPNSRDPGPPPPLPPPKDLPDIIDNGKGGPDIAWKFGNSHDSNSEWGGSVPSVTTGSSLYGSFLGRRKEEQGGISMIKSIDTKENSYPRFDEGYGSQSGTSIGSNISKYQEAISPVSGFQSSVHDRYRSSNAQAYDKSLLQKLDARRGTDNSTPPGYTSRFSSSANDTSPTSRIPLEYRQPSQLKPLSLPILTGRPSLVESPLSRWAAGDTPISGTSPGGNPYYKFGSQGHLDHRTPSDTAESDRSPIPYIKRSGSGSAPDDASSITSRSREGYDQRISPDHDVDFQMEDSGFTRLQIDDYSTRSDSAYSPSAMIGQKRRASSPPRDDGPSLHTVGSASDLFRRRESASRASPSPRFHSASGSVSSTASGPRNNTYASSLSVAERSSTTSAGSYGNLSSGSVSPRVVDMMDTSYTTSNPSPRASISRPHHQRTLSESRPLLTSRNPSESSTQPKHNTAPKMQGVFMCECCPKKPKKFDSQEELNVHEQEKQYQCAYCCNRFKNKNEAERHQNSLHLRRHSWSCAALSGYAAAFHNSPNRPNEADTCGYCGEDFPRSGTSSPSVLTAPVATATDQDWEVRINHLQEMHKFGECNHAKKFFRADHFRQHLKHSHAGMSGKWTNMLENACMKDEPLPEPIRGPERVSPGGHRVGRISEEEEGL